MPLPRFHLRTLMIAVALVALFAVGAVIVRKAREYRDAARRHGIMARVIEIEAGPAPTRRERERAAYHDRMKGKYDSAASRPWLSVAPDPPEPK